MEQSWQRLDLERIDDTVLGEGKKVRYGFFGKRQQKHQEDFNQIRLDKKDVCLACSKHTNTILAIVSDSLREPVELFEVHSLKAEQTGSGVPIKHELECDMCLSQEWYVRSLVEQEKLKK